MATEESSRSKLGLLIGAAALILAAAGFFAWRGTGGSTDQLSTAAWPYICQDCGNVVDMSPAEYAKRISAQNALQDNGDAPLRRANSVRCEKCGKGTLVVGDRCPKDGSTFPRNSSDGPGKCPKCGWHQPTS